MTAQTEVAIEPAVEPDEIDSALLDQWNLVWAAQKGDMEAYGQLYDRYRDVIFRFALFRLSDRSLAEDITSETFLRALRRIASVRYQGQDIGAWLVTIARNLILDHVKSSQHRLEMTTAEILDAGSDSGGPEHEVVELIVHAELRRCIRMLTPEQQECIRLRYFQGLSSAETAIVMSRNRVAVNALALRARERLKQLLPKEFRFAA